MYSGSLIRLDSSLSATLSFPQSMFPKADEGMRLPVLSKPHPTELRQRRWSLRSINHICRPLKNKYEYFTWNANGIEDTGMASKDNKNRRDDERNRDLIFLNVGAELNGFKPTHDNKGSAAEERKVKEQDGTLMDHH